jgi:hypothetical protein
VCSVLCVAGGRALGRISSKGSNQTCCRILKAGIRGTLACIAIQNKIADDDDDSVPSLCGCSASLISFVEERFNTKC